MRFYRHALLLTVCLVFSLIDVPFTSGAAGRNAPPMPSQCLTGKTSTEAVTWRWKPDAHVTVYILKDNFTSDQKSAIAEAVGNWNSALNEIGSSIVFDIGGESEAEVNTDGSVTVLRGVPRGSERVGETRLFPGPHGVRRARVTVGVKVTSVDAILSLMTHELGHTLGLADCYKCKRGTTTMAAFRDDNDGNQVFKPSECDKYVVASSYSFAVAGVASPGN